MKKQEEKKVNIFIDTLNTGVSIKDRVSQAKDYILQEENSFESGVKLKYMAKLIDGLIGKTANKEIKAKIKKDTLEYLKHNDSKIVTEAITHTSYDFKSAGHNEYNELANILDQVKKRMKFIEDNDLIPLTKSLESGKIFEEGSITLNKGSKSIMQEYFYTFEQHDDGATVNEILPPQKIQKRDLKYNIK